MSNNTAIGRLLDIVRERGIATDSTQNPFWQNQMKTLSDLAKDQAYVQPEDFRKKLRYDVLSLPIGVDDNRSYEKNRKILSIIKKKIMPAVRCIDEYVVESGDVNHCLCLVYMFQNNKLDEYLRFLDDMGYRSCMPAVRYFLYSEELGRAVRDPVFMGSHKTILEIGAGAGELALFLRQRNLVQNYIIVDLPEMLVNACFNIGQKHSDIKFTVNADLSGVLKDDESNEVTVHFLTPDMIDSIPVNFVDISLNFNSFMEMDRDVRDSYIGHVYRVTRSGGIFYNVNRRQRTMSMRDDSSYDNNPLMYPYQSSDLVLHWQPDEIQQAYRSGVARTNNRSFAISRMAIVNP